ncbi:MAG: UMP kinase [Methanopyri archaeon]|nr:UMP kinase [Methanopyri archaeon]
MRVTVALGGSVVNVEEPDRIEKTAEVLKRAVSSGLELAVVVGGGPVARRYINVARNLGAPESYLDVLGIEVTRLNARLLLAAMGVRDPRVPEDPFEAAALVEREGLAVCGGTHPGHTTDAVAAMIADVLGSPLVVVTNVDGVYDRHPEEEGAVKLDELDPESLEELAFQAELEAGGSFVIDPLAAKLIRRAGLTTHVVSWEEFVELGVKDVVDGKHDGTVIRG